MYVSILNYQVYIMHEIQIVRCREVQSCLSYIARRRYIVCPRLMGPGFYSRTKSLCCELIRSLGLTIVDAEDLCKVRVVESTLSIGERTVEQAIDLKSAWRDTGNRRAWPHLLLRHSIAELAEPFPHLFDVDITFISLVKTCESFEDVMFWVEFEQMFPHHR